MKRLYLLILLVMLAILSVGCLKEVNYYNNPNIAQLIEDREIVQMEGYNFSIEDGVLTIDENDTHYEIKLPDKGRILSLHLSYDKQFLAYDVKGENGVKIYIVNLDTGSVTNLSDTIGYNYDYDNYHTPYGIAWSPNQNIIAFIGGQDKAARIDLYHLEMDINKQLHAGSFIFDDIYGVKWNENGSSICYVEPPKDDGSMYHVYETEIEFESYLQSGTVTIIGELTHEDYIEWLEK
ncbi:hypothetical protein ACFSTA_04560 [Ornithinibacillus salinisoli]|uniref:Uncharacterized protein n=1 Tax=Ornithinibacillus salinisoli TaxID=1848459 RepID=A0ABW4VYN2_9BACI